MFKDKKYHVIKKALSYDTANFIFNYLLLKRDAVRFMYDHNIHAESFILGKWNDVQAPDTFSCYGDFAMETLLVKMLPIMKKEIDLDLVPTYSYARAYKKGDELHRPSCEISTTLNLGGDPWPIFIDGTGTVSVINEKENIVKPDAPAGTKILLEVGDMLVYSGCELEHWREPFEGDICGQVFLHYNNLNGPFAEKNKFDGRPMLGLPAAIKRITPL